MTKLLFEDISFWESFLSDRVLRIIDSLSPCRIFLVSGRDDSRSIPLIHDHPELAVVLKGSIRLETTGDNTVLSEGDVALVAPQMYHKPITLSPFSEVLWVALTQSHTGIWLIRKKQGQTGEGACLRGIDMLNLPQGSEMIFMIIREIEEKTVDWERMVMNTLSSLFISIKRRILIRDRLLNDRDRNSRIDTLILSAQNFIESNYASDLSVDEVSHFVALSANYFANQFKTRTGGTIGNYITKVRMKEALRLLRETDLLISEIAFKTGYGSPFYFSRVFHSHFGVSPSDFRALGK
jgi:AraC-like DNA-binding protein